MTHRAAPAGRLLTVLLVVAACAGPALVPSREPSQQPNPSTSGGQSPVTASPEPGQTDTSWGRIWDELPGSFPVFPGAVPAADTADAVSAALAIEGPDPGEVASWMQSHLEDASFTTEGFNGPLEDGSFVLDLVAGGGCRVQVTAAPLGSLTSLIVRYGAGCPAP